ncbi:alpha-methylacyl-CoA racemase-like isoform X2 [Mizuhopecten yessoensis]|uniref:Alpha-methylacyl-CoA racemase n=2 Tax=Mizuhopecten yessoensis TaxID=6573 RepID=A0A210PRF7_MIZYE|nr:alpha-methylacyl-CoA racemase-like isoform X2 [Mizuhopecten yessoensis]OWF39044.1 Alpha-methylacyl-CoA racemase [Mizuhopecten yessoensis]
MALKGIRVVELAGLAPAPFCAMILADFGAKVVRVDRVKSQMGTDRLGRGKQSVAVDLKKKEGVEVVRRMCSKADVVIEPFRTGVMEKLGLGPDKLLSDNPRLVYARLTGFGQQGPWAAKAGHDVNYISLAGILGQLGRKGERPYPPINLLADFAGGGLTCAFGITMALFERSTSGKGQVIDSNMVEGSAYIGTWLWKSRPMPIWGKERGDNVLDGGSPFYDTYETKDGKYVGVGALEPQFFNDLVKGLGLSNEVSQFDDPAEMRQKFKERFLSKSRDEWDVVFDGLDACYSPILDHNEAPLHPHNVHNKSFLKDAKGRYEPAPAPRLSRTPGVDEVYPTPRIGEHTSEVLQEIGFSQNEINSFISNGAVENNKGSSKL